MIKTSRLKVNCTSLGNLTTSAQGSNPPTEKQWRDFFNHVNKPVEKLTSPQMFAIREIVNKQIDYNPEQLSQTVINEMCEIYALEKYGKRTISGGGTKPHSLDKGRIGEYAAIDLLSKIDNYSYKKNERFISNAYFKGKPDILISIGDTLKDIVGVKEIKVPYDYPSFLKLYNDPIDKDNSWQMQGYMDILKLDESELVHCLVSMPETMLNSRMEELCARLKIIGICDDEITQRCDFLKNDMVYDNIPDEEKIIRYTVYRNQQRAKEARGRVKLARKWITQLHEKIEKSVALAKK
jgi:hypothetical protein